MFFLILFVFGVVGCNSEPNNETPVPSTVSSTDIAIVPVSKSDQWWIDRHNDRINNVITNQKIIFIGDSITQAWEGTEAWTVLNQQCDNKITNLGFSGDRTQHVIWRLENGEFPVGINPENVVIMIGTNNSSDQHKPESIAAGIDKIVKIINGNSPSTRIVLLSILPRGSGNDDGYTQRNNAVNEIIKKYDGYLGISYLNIAQYYVDNNGTLKNELFTDRLHLTSAGYNLWKEKILEIIQ
jgi:lysophospholipase L1-like esterase